MTIAVDWDVNQQPKQKKNIFFFVPLVDAPDATPSKGTAILW